MVMDRDVRLAALRATAKVAFSLSVVACGSASPSPEVPVDPAHAKPTPKPAPVTTDPPAPSASAGYVAGHATCKAALDDAFGPGVRKPTPEVQACCREMMRSVTDMAHYGDCCEVYESSDPEMRVGCSPWGPPVPPRMRGVA
jgi:hypothetical protein